MILLRIKLTSAFLWLGAALADLIMPEFAPLKAMKSEDPGTTRCPAGTILLACIVGMAICTVWIAITWRAMG